jgi:hypothetical protein
MSENNVPKTRAYYFAMGVLAALLAGIMAVVSGERAALSVTMGVFSSGVMFFFIEWLARGLLLKKSVAITGSAIVFKYAILGFILYLVVTVDAVHKEAFLIGFSSFIPGAILWIWSLKKGKHRPQI